MNNGELTAKIAQTLMEKFAGRVDILYDHGDPKLDQVGVIRSWFGNSMTRKSILADLDIAVVLPKSNYALMLIEIEESTASPKKILGDIFASLLSERFTFQRTHHLDVDKQTVLMVLSHGKTRNELINFINTRLGDFKLTRLKVLIRAFENDMDLERKLADEIENALRNRNI